MSDSKAAPKPTKVKATKVKEEPLDNNSDANEEQPSNPPPKIAKAPSKYQEKKAKAVANKASGKRYDTAYCVRCKANKPMKNAHEAKTSNNRNMLKGECAGCGGHIHVFVPKDYKHQQ